MIIDKMSRGGADRGWAWIIVAGVTIINLAILPIQQSFGLIFRERFFLLDITATQTSLIVHLSGTITSSLGLISGPMMKKFTFREVAFLGGLTVAIGICATAFAVSLPAIIITYCIIVGIGHGIIFPATNLAMNTYFRKKRNVAMGLSVTLTGLGPILMPLLIAKLLENYATTGTLLIIAGIAMHSLIGAALLKPFKEREITSITKDNDITASSAESNENGILREVKIKLENVTDVKNDGANSKLLEERLVQNTSKFEQNLSENVNSENSKGEKKSILGKITQHMDLDLLRDSRYVAVILGMGVSLVAETNFNTMIPFVLTELSGLGRDSIATIMSIQAVSDITGRLCIPLLAHKAGWTSRNLYVLSLIGSTIGRTILSTWGSTYIVVIGVALIIGIAKGTKAVFQTLIIPDYVSLDRLPAAYGMQMVCNGILSIAVGPLIGLVHDQMMSYVGALHFTSILSLSCVVLWYMGGLWTFNKSIKKHSAKEEISQVQENCPECNA
ncbi:monocarboxylate transporter 9-like isoform X1 [Bombus pascuorum]|uniref:monocarboxylate transporter 9-like isoform X1 n=1 Tax=Bombus pascuorum TaxID=65598 RepID=UPI00211FE053|nr:monocarboxylate transporter 9-like isoform X1 [Bombus pascuorum]XP_060811735.1 monocarboxylate transporter 9-like isoform X1 [Bombus pascuorum]XP_060811736.1 monocarboxylate transporter 9-like isoform X1 [Bombus pascuorum]